MHDLCQNKATEDKHKYTSLGKEYEDFSFIKSWRSICLSRKKANIFEMTATKWRLVGYVIKINFTIIETNSYF